MEKDHFDKDVGIYSITFTVVNRLPVLEAVWE
jgi:hypothetical protein